MANNKPTIKATNRAFVRLYKKFHSHAEWEKLLQSYQVKMIALGQARNGDCGVVVTDSSGMSAALGLSIPNKITYSRFIEPAVETWIEFYSDGKQTRRRVLDGLERVSSDQIA